MKLGTNINPISKSNKHNIETEDIGKQPIKKSKSINPAKDRKVKDKPKTKEISLSLKQFYILVDTPKINEQILLDVRAETKDKAINIIMNEFGEGTEYMVLSFAGELIQYTGKVHRKNLKPKYNI